MKCFARILMLVCLCGVAQAAAPATRPSIQATMVTLQHQNGHASSVLPDLSRQSGMLVRMISEEEAPLLTLNEQQQPFLKVVRDLCSRLKTQPTPSASPSIMLLTPDDLFIKRPAFVSGPLMVIAEELHHTDSVHASGVNRTSTFDASLAVYMDPKLRVLQWSPQVKWIEAVDDAGNSLLPKEAAEQEMTDEADIQPVWMINVEGAMKYPAKPGKRIAKLKGEVRLWVLAGSENWEIRDFFSAKEQTHTAAGHRFTLTKVERGEETPGFKLNLVFHRDNMPESQWETFQKYSLSQLLRVYDEKDRLLHLAIARDPRTRSKKDSINLTILMTPADEEANKDLGKPTKLVWTLPTEVTPMNFPFEFNNLPMP